MTDLGQTSSGIRPMSKADAGRGRQLRRLAKVKEERGNVEVKTLSTQAAAHGRPALVVGVTLAALSPVRLATAGERAEGTVLWMAEDRGVGGRALPRITKAAQAAGRPAPRAVTADSR